MDHFYFSFCSHMIHTSSRLASTRPTPTNINLETVSKMNNRHDTEPYFMSAILILTGGLKYKRPC